MMKFLKQTVVSILVSIVTVVAVYGGYSIYAKDYAFSGYSTYFLVFNLYHKEMNEFFNKKMQALNKLMDSENFYNDPEKKKLINPPSIAKAGPNQKMEDILKACGEENVSSYCVSMGALDIYMAYVGKLNSLKGNLANVEARTSMGLSVVLEATRQQNEAIEEEFNSAKKVMEATVAAYNEYHLAYPMHKKYQEVTKNLIKYKLALKDIRKRTARFPAKFVDSSTVECN